MMCRISGTTGKSRDCDKAAKTVQTNKKRNAELGSAFFALPLISLSRNLVKKRVGTKYQPVFSDVCLRQVMLQFV